MASYPTAGRWSEDETTHDAGEGNSAEESAFWSFRLVESAEEFSPWGLLGSDGNLAISPTEMLNLAEGLNMEDFMILG